MKKEVIIIVLTKHALISDPASAKIVIEVTNVQDNVDVSELTNVQKCARVVFTSIVIVVYIKSVIPPF